MNRGRIYYNVIDFLRFNKALSERWTYERNLSASNQNSNAGIRFIYHRVRTHLFIEAAFNRRAGQWRRNNEVQERLLLTSNCLLNEKSNGVVRIQRRQRVSLDCCL